ncbi:MAG: ligase [Ilumatobacteraceae bacterium]|nr:ligase [Ilumatobacteraceae bacterium]
MTALVALVDASRAATATSKRLAKVAALADALGSLDPDEIVPAVGLLVGAPRQGRLGVGWATLADRRPTPADQPTLTVLDVDRAFAHLAAAQGSGSQRERGAVLEDLFARSTRDEQDHLYRVIIGELRQGANEGVLTDAVAKAAGRPVAEVRRAAMLLGDLGAAARVALTGGDLDVGLTPLVGVQPMLAATARTVTDALALTGPASVEWKLDGARIQVHRSGDDVRVFTRSLHEIGARVPDIVTAALAVPVERFVVDGESLGLDLDGNPLKFQDTMTASTALRPFFFDVLHVGGESLIDRPLAERKAALAELVPSPLRLPTLDTGDSEAAEVFAQTALDAGHEGVMVKALDSPYQAGRRGATWRKVKPVHTLDLVVLAAEWGHGRRRGWLSNLHLGARGPDSTFVMVGKTFKGMTDQLLTWQTAELQRLAIGDEAGPAAHVVHVRPERVVEIALDGVQRSTRYPGGVALRFARVRRYRDDKTPAEADTIDRVRALL